MLRLHFMRINFTS